jgi:hypothetical protein
MRANGSLGLVSMGERVRFVPGLLSVTDIGMDSAVTGTQ